MLCSFAFSFSNRIQSRLASLGFILGLSCGSVVSADVIGITVGTQSAVGYSDLNNNLTTTYSTTYNQSAPFSGTVTLAELVGGTAISSLATYFVGQQGGAVVFNLSGSASVPGNTDASGNLAFLGSFVDIGLGTGCDCGGDNPPIPSVQFTVDQQTAYTISASYTVDGTARSQIAAALVMSGPQGSPVFSYNNLTNAPDSYTFSGTLAPGTYTYSALYSLDNSTEGVSPTATSGTGYIDFTLNDQFLDAANPEPATLTLLLLGLAVLWLETRRGKQKSRAKTPLR